MYELTSTADIVAATARYMLTNDEGYSRERRPSTHDHKFLRGAP